jgi:hypothetical protein
MSRDGKKTLPRPSLRGFPRIPDEPVILSVSAPFQFETRDATVDQPRAMADLTAASDRGG